jgi:hypothetical protein
VRDEQRGEVGDGTASRWRFQEEGEGEEGTSGGGRCGVPGGDLGRKGRERKGRRRLRREAEGRRARVRVAGGACLYTRCFGPAV